MATGVIKVSGMPRAISRRVVSLATLKDRNHPRRDL